MWRFLIVDNSDGTVRGTDDESIAHSYVGPDDYYVIDATTYQDTQVMLYRDGTRDVAELDISECMKPLPSEEVEDIDPSDEPTELEEDDPEDSRN